MIVSDERLIEIANNSSPNFSIGNGDFDELRSICRELLYLRRTTSNGSGARVSEFLTQYRAGDTFNIATVREIAKGQLPPKAIYNGLVYLTRIGVVERISYGRYRMIYTIDKSK